MKDRQKADGVRQKAASADADAADGGGGGAERRALSESSKVANQEEEAAAATRIQAGFTGMMVRQQLQARPVQ